MSEMRASVVANDRPLQGVPAVRRSLRKRVGRYSMFRAWGYRLDRDQAQRLVRIWTNELRGVR